MRLQGVFVSDPEIARVTDHWRGQIDDPRYDKYPRVPVAACPIPIGTMNVAGGG